MLEGRPDVVLDFWFQELAPAQWFRKDTALDATIVEHFGALQLAASRSELWLWRRSPLGRLAEVIVLDQFSRHMYRDTPEAFANDTMALALAQEAVAQAADRHLDVAWRPFLYMPYMHSESLAIHEEALRLFDQSGLEENLRIEHRHREILQRFGRYPHRNAILGRESSAEELAFLDEPGSAF